MTESVVKFVFQTVFVVMTRTVFLYPFLLKTYLFT